MDCSIWKLTTLDPSWKKCQQREINLFFPINWDLGTSSLSVLEFQIAKLGRDAEWAIIWTCRFNFCIIFYWALIEEVWLYPWALIESPATRKPTPGLRRDTLGVIFFSVTSLLQLKQRPFLLQANSLRLIMCRHKNLASEEVTWQ